MRLESELRFFQECKVGVGAVLSANPSIAGWAMRAFTPVFDGLRALALPFHIGKACRAPCPPSACICLAAVLLFTSPAQADDIADFYRGKTVTITVSAGAGGGYDTLGRTVARFLNKHLPGNPFFVVRNMAGSGGLAAANALFSGAEKDGTHIGLLQSNSPFDPLLGTSGAKFDGTTFHWLDT